MKLISKLVSLCKKVYFSVLSSSHTDNPYLLYKLRKDYNIYVPREVYPDIGVYLDQLKASPNSDHLVTLKDVDFVPKDGFHGIYDLVDKENFKLSRSAQIWYEPSDNLIPLVLTYKSINSDKDECQVLYTLLYDSKKYDCLAVCIFHPLHNMLAIYYTTSKRFLVRVGASRIYLDGAGFSENGITPSIWRHNNYFRYDTIKFLDFPLSFDYLAKGKIWFTQPFPKISRL